MKVQNPSEEGQHKPSKANTSISRQAIDTVIEALEDHGSVVKPSGNNGYMAQCPAHDDRNPSLSVAQGDKGAVLKCFADCELDAILGELGLVVADLFDDAPEQRERITAKPKVIAEYPYVDTEGELCFIVERMEPKRFRQKKPDGNGGWSWKTSDLPDEVRGLPYRITEIAKALANDPTMRVLVVEGEKDVNSLWKQGELATSIAGGANSSNSQARLDAFYGHLKAAGATTLVIVADRDTPGREHAQRLLAGAQRAGIESQALELACNDGCKDVTDAIKAHGDECFSSVVSVANVANVASSPVTSGNSLENMRRMRRIASHVLPKLGVLGDFATNLAVAKQVDIEFALVTALATVGLPVGLSVNVEVRSDWVEPAILQFLLIAPPSERKTPVLHACMSPLYDAEREAREARRAEIAHAKAVEAELELEKTNARKHGGYRDACEKLENHTIPNEFRAILGKATAEALEVQAARQGERLARIVVASDEGGAVFGDLGRYQNSTNWELLLAGYDAQRYSSDRLSRDPILVDELRIPLLLMLQPSAWGDVVADSAASGRGVLARLSPIRPRSLVGERFGFGPEISKVLTAKWAQVLTTLFAQAYASDEAIRLPLSSGAFEVWAAFKDEVEIELGDGTFEGDLLTGWGGKKAGRALRLAAIVHAALTGKLGGTISEGEMSLGIELAEWLSLHALRELSGATTMSRDAQRLAKVIEGLCENSSEFARSEAIRHLHGWRVERFMVAAQELEKTGGISALDKRGMRWKVTPDAENSDVLVEDEADATDATQASHVFGAVSPAQSATRDVYDVYDAPDAVFRDSGDWPPFIQKALKGFAAQAEPKEPTLLDREKLQIGTGSIAKIDEGKLDHSSGLWLAYQKAIRITDKYWWLPYCVGGEVEDTPWTWVEIRLAVKPEYSLDGRTPVKRDRLIVMVMGKAKRPVVLIEVDPLNGLPASAKYLSEILEIPIEADDLCGGNVIELQPALQPA
jgi:5S rRNA maturation endonuclease (ribonuclease M5)